MINSKVFKYCSPLVEIFKNYNPQLFLLNFVCLALSKFSFALFAIGPYSNKILQFCICCPKILLVSFFTSLKFHKC